MYGWGVVRSASREVDDISVKVVLVIKNLKAWCIRVTTLNLHEEKLYYG